LTPSFLLNFSSLARDLALFHGNWQKLADFVSQQGFNGVELYPVENVDPEQIPKGLIRGLHLRFFVLQNELWKGDIHGLKRIFGSLDTVRAFYGSTNKEAILSTYVNQLELAQALGCSYVVFHIAHVDLEHVYDWQMKTDWQETLEIGCQIMNEALSASTFEGYVLFENLWWPNGFNLGPDGQFEFILNEMKYEKCGLCLDTGHLLLESGGFDTQKEALDFLRKRLRGLTHLKEHIVSLHLSCTLSGAYLTKTKEAGLAGPSHRNFWKRFSQARAHVLRLDKHDPFEMQGTCQILELTEPRFVVFEFRFSDLDTWKRKIFLQKKALEGCWS